MELKFFFFLKIYPILYTDSEKPTRKFLTRSFSNEFGTLFCLAYLPFNGKYAKQNNKKACKVGKTGKTEKIVRDGHIA